MSNSSARAKQRRANIVPPVPQQNQNQNQNQTQQRTGGMTLPQVLQIVDSRITNLEKIAKEQMNKNEGVNLPMAPKIEVDESWKEILKEYETRFTMLATEINDLKDIVMKLQSYTMDVNKTLLEERVHIMGDVSDVKEEIVMIETGTDPVIDNIIIDTNGENGDIEDNDDSEDKDDSEEKDYIEENNDSEENDE